MNWPGSRSRFPAADHVIVFYTVATSESFNALEAFLISCVRNGKTRLEMRSCPLAPAIAFTVIIDVILAIKWYF